MSNRSTVGVAVAGATRLMVLGRVLVYVAQKLLAALEIAGFRPPTGAHKTALSSWISATGKRLLASPEYRSLGLYTSSLR